MGPPRRDGPLRIRSPVYLGVAGTGPVGRPLVRVAPGPEVGEVSEPGREAETGDARVTRAPSGPPVPSVTVGPLTIPRSPCHDRVPPGPRGLEDRVSTTDYPRPVPSHRSRFKTHTPETPVGPGV